MRPRRLTNAMQNGDEMENRPRRTSWILKWMLAAWILAACGPLGGDSGALDGTSWRMSSYRDTTGQIVPVLPGTEVTAEFQEGGIGGSATCNRYFGEVVIEGDQLAIQGIGMTEMYCFPEENMEQEAAYIAALSAAASYQVDGAQLTIADATGRTLLTFARR